MADAPAGTSAGKKSSLGFLAKKLGPAPVWVYAVVIVGVYYWYTHYGPGAKAAAAAASTDATDPATGISYADELAAAAQQISDLQASQAAGRPGPAGPAGPQGPAGPAGPGDKDKPPVPVDQPPGRCKPGWHFEPLPKGAGTIPVGAYRVTGGVCVRDKAVAGPPGRKGGGGTGPPTKKPKKNVPGKRVPAVIPAAGPTTGPGHNPKATPGRGQISPGGPALPGPVTASRWRVPA